MSSPARPRPTSRLDRRRFLAGLGATGLTAGLVAACGGSSGSSDGGPSGGASAGTGVTASTRSSRAGGAAAGVLNDRRLLVLELDGGNDGFSTLVPYGDGHYVDHRPSMALSADEVIAVDDAMGLAPSLQLLSGRPLAWVEGVGSTSNPDFSHFEMLRRWSSGDEQGDGGLHTGFLGRLCDELRADEAVTGVSLAGRPSPIMAGELAGTLSLPSPDDLWLFTEDPDESAELVAIRAGIAAMADGADPIGGTTADMLDRARLGTGDALRFAEVLPTMPDEPDDRYPGGDLSDRLQIAAALLAGDARVRVVHVPFGGFDTHSDHRGDHEYLWSQIDAALDAFLTDIENQDRAGDVLVATISEFGRRLPENDGGLDHGWASTMMLTGPVVDGFHGERPDLTDLDDGNVQATIPFDAYYASLAEEWFEVPATEVLPGSPSPIGGLIA